MLDQEDKIFYINSRTELLLDKKFNDLLSTPLDEALKLRIRESGEPCDLNLLRAMSKDELFSKEFILKTTTADVPIGDVLLKIVNGKDGDTYTLVLFENISDRIKARELEIDIDKRRIKSLIEGQENERSRLARDIHDGIGQLINLIKLKIKDVEKGGAKDELNTLLEQTLEEVRNVSENLQPSSLNNFSLERNIEKLIDQFKENSTIKFDFMSSDVPDLGLKSKTHLFRVVQEALSNILKHSEASTSTVQLYGLVDKLQLTIEDDGGGFNPKTIDKTNAHHGIQNIEYRVNSLNGNFTVDSNEKSGTMLLITVPF